MPRIQLAERGRRALAWASFVIFQAGLFLAILSGFQLWLPEVNVLFAPAMLLQTMAVMLFTVHIYPRIRPALVRATLEKNLQ